MWPWLASSPHPEIYPFESKLMGPLHLRNEDSTDIWITLYNQWFSIQHAIKSPPLKTWSWWSGVQSEIKHLHRLCFFPGLEMAWIQRPPVSAVGASPSTCPIWCLLRQLSCLCCQDRNPPHQVWPCLGILYVLCLPVLCRSNVLVVKEWPTDRNEVEKGDNLGISPLG